MCEKNTLILVVPLYPEFLVSIYNGLISSEAASVRVKARSRSSELDGSGIRCTDCPRNQSCLEMRQGNWRNNGSLLQMDCKYMSCG